VQRDLASPTTPCFLAFILCSLHKAFCIPPPLDAPSLHENKAARVHDEVNGEFLFVERCFEIMVLLWGRCWYRCNLAIISGLIGLGFYLLLVNCGD
jgi:hypothetical protein